MSISLHSAPWLLGDAELIRLIGRELPDVIDVERRPAAYGSSAHLEEVRARSSLGQVCDLMLKAHHPPDSTSSTPVRPAFMTDPVREVAVYRSILDPLSVASPGLFASGVDPEGEWSWLLLERVRGKPLWQFGDPGPWCESARWLAEHHARFAGDAVPTATDAPLLTLDRDHHMGWLERARALVSEGGNGAVDVLSELGARHYPIILDELAAAPISFLHGEIFPSNVLVRDADGRDSSGDSICPLDWESAATGPCSLDLAALTSGSWDPATRRLVEEAYRVRAAELGSWGRDPVRFRGALEAARVQLALVQLGWSADWSPPREHRHDWLGDIANWLRERAT